MPEEIIKDGALIDTRPPEEKRKDYKIEEMVASFAPVNWTEKPVRDWRRFPIFNQDGSGSCVAQTMAKLLGVLYYLKNGLYVHFSATHVYQRRSNKPAGGMAGVDAFKIAQQGITLEELVPSQNMSDSQMDGIVIDQYKKDVGSIFKIPNYVELPFKDIDAVASVIQHTKKAVMVWCFFENREWLNVPKILNPNLDLYAAATARHSIAAVDFTLYQGEKALIIEDSWGPGTGLGGQRILTESFFKARNFFAAYPIAFVFDDQSPTPTPAPAYTFTKILKFGETNADIVALQKALQYFGFFPANIATTGYYGAITADAILKWQKANNVASLDELNSLAGRVFGPKSIAKMNGALT